MIRGTQQRGPVRLVRQDESTLEQRSALGVGMLLILAVLLAPFVAIGAAWAVFYAVKAIDAAALVARAVLS